MKVQILWDFCLFGGRFHSHNFLFPQAPNSTSSFCALTQGCETQPLQQVTSATVTQSICEHSKHLQRLGFGEQRWVYYCKCTLSGTLAISSFKCSLTSSPSGSFPELTAPSVPQHHTILLALLSMCFLAPLLLPLPLSVQNKAFFSLKFE